MCKLAKLREHLQIFSKKCCMMLQLVAWQAPCTFLVHRLQVIFLCTAALQSGSTCSASFELHATTICWGQASVPCGQQIDVLKRLRTLLPDHPSGFPQCILKTAFRPCLWWGVLVDFNAHLPRLQHCVVPAQIRSMCVADVAAICTIMAQLGLVPLTVHSSDGL